MPIGEVQIQPIATGGLGVQDADIGGESVGIEDRLSRPLIDASSTLALLPQFTMGKQALMAIPPLDEERGRLEKLDFLGSELWSGQATPLSSKPLSSSLTERDVDSVNRPIWGPIKGNPIGAEQSCDEPSCAEPRRSLRGALPARCTSIRVHSRWRPSLHVAPNRSNRRL